MKSDGADIGEPKGTKRSALVRWSVRLVTAVGLITGSLAGWQWFASEAHSFRSVALQETRTVTVYNPHSVGPVIYALDGNSVRNGLAPAIIFSVAAILRGEDLPRIVAVSSNANRDRDFRRARGTPTYWRPQIAGRSDQFDIFLFDEVIPIVENEPSSSRRRYLMGHSLSGLYALELAARRPEQFAGAFVFAPTFSHDTSVSDRIANACRTSRLIYVNWGLESARDTDVFETTATDWKSNDRCRQSPPEIWRHYGSPHQTIMLTGQLQVAFSVL